MASSLNHITIIGRVGKDPEVRVSAKGMAVASFSVATGEKRKDTNGFWKEETQWHRCTAFDKTAQFINNYVKKGAKVYVEGKVVYEEYLNKENVKVYSTKIIVNQLITLDKREASNEAAPEEKQYHEQQSNATNNEPGEDDVPY